MEIYIDIPEYTENGAFGATLVLDATLIEHNERIEAYGRVMLSKQYEVVVSDARLFECDQDGGETELNQDVEYTDFISDDELVLKLIEGEY